MEEILPKESASIKSVGSNGCMKKKVCFAEGTIEPRQDNVALSISRHTYSKELGYTQYFIQLMFRETEWSLYKRYRDFEELHNNLMSENFENGIDLPKLPKKRWFEKQRWLNKFDESYSSNRRCALQEYLRCLVHIPYLRRRSSTLKQFLDFRFNDSDERVPDSVKRDDQRNEFYSGRGDTHQPEDPEQQSHPEVVNEHHHTGIWHGDTVAPHHVHDSSVVSSSEQDILLETQIEGQSSDPNGAYFINSPARSREGSEDSEYDYNARVVNTSTDYNSNDSDDEPETEGLIAETERDSLQPATPEEVSQLLSVERGSEGVIVTDSGEVLLKGKRTSDGDDDAAEDTRTTFSS